MLSSIKLAYHSLTLLLYCSCLSSFIFVIVCGLFEWRHVFFYRVCIYVLPLEIQLSRGEGWNRINRSKAATFVRLSQAGT